MAQENSVYDLAYGNIPKRSISLGPFTTNTLLSDPFHLSFQLARHRFTARMLNGCKSLLEVGCQEGFTSLLFAKSCETLLAIDNNPDHIADAKMYSQPWSNNIIFRCHDIIKEPLPEAGVFDGAFTIDTLEHIPKADEDVFIRRILSSLKPKGKLVIGIPSTEQQRFTSPQNKIGHINCKTFEELGDLCDAYFNYVNVLTMNDEIVHAGFPRTANYLFAVCALPRSI
jgi:SAM-dependent methyltransferase